MNDTVAYLDGRKQLTNDIKEYMKTIRVKDFYENGAHQISDMYLSCSFPTIGTSESGCDFPDGLLIQVKTTTGNV